MLNGKFYTGLPPKMMDRGFADGPNRLESHLFWPDDTQVDTAVESRIKRRHCIQRTSTERPLYEKQNSVVDNDVDTKKRFTKEFSQSSIKFYDNLNEDCGNSRRPMLRNSLFHKKTNITEKPTNTKQEMPDSTANDAYTAAKKKQAYTSNIEFYDYVNDREQSQNNRNNLRKPKMDMNDKREMELNSKNSPKLQLKRDVRSLSEEKEERKVNNREVRGIERPTRTYLNDIYDQRERFITKENSSLKSRRSVEPRINVSPKRGLAKANNNHEQRYASEREICRQPFYENSEVSDYTRDYENFDDTSSYRHMKEEPNRIITHNTRRYYDAPDDSNYSQKYQDEEVLRNRMQDVYLKSPTPSTQYYAPEEFYDDEIQHDYDQVKTPTNRGSSHQHYGYNNREVNNTPKRFNNDNLLPVNKIYNKNQQEPVRSSTSPPPSDAESSVSATKSPRHLRSSLCFNNGEIIGENYASRSPTSSHSTPQRRNARSSATQRVSVGLPD